MSFVSETFSAMDSYPMIFPAGYVGEQGKIAPTKAIAPTKFPEPKMPHTMKLEGKAPATKPTYGHAVLRREMAHHAMMLPYTG